MMYAVTGATGTFGRRAVESLLERGVPAGDIVAIGRAVEKITDLADRGVQVRAASYDDPESLRTALEGVDRLLLVSGSEVGQRVQQHQNVIDSAVAADVDLLVYTSLINAQEGGLMLAGEHVATEQQLAASGLDHTLLRNGWYTENYTDQLPTYLRTGAVIGTAAEGRISGATRADLAEAGAAVLVGEGHAGQVYELGADDAFTLAELAEAITQASGTQVAYHDMPADDFRAALLGAEVPAPFADVLVNTAEGGRTGALQTDSGDLSRLLGRPATSMAEAIRSAVDAG